MKNVLLNITFGPGDRKETLNSILDYYGNFNDDELPYIVITDQSIKTWDNLKHRVIKAVHHYPVDKYNMYQMWVELCEKYPHKYFCWNNDDDFTVPQSLTIADDFLNRNPKYTIVQGQVVQLSPTSNVENYAKSTWEQQDCNSNDAKSRVKETFTNLHANPHAVFRKSTFVNACKLCINSFENGNNFGALRFWDKVLCYVSAVDGYRKTNLDCLMSIRSHRAFTQQVAHIAKTYHPILERNTVYEEMYTRLKKDNNEIIKYFTKANGQTIEIDFLLSIFKKSNMGFTNARLPDQLPFHQEKWKQHINLALKSWKFIK